ncbi:class II fructose-bisphosphate aldolase [Streptomyces sp. NK15101]|uniref:class II fructose-bisphosphate aldolase n=1 Tax=Streptomyces sp. NK15101 TaxID=2873261 RepID=UPI001CECAE2A|nr:class II fructose-bisphosphate aldolase [Streptomyces sp. NK15101]
MPLTPTDDIIGPAYAQNRGVGAFNVVRLEHAEAIVDGAHRAGLPVILQISENTVRYHGSLAPIGRAALSLAEEATVPVAVHLDHAESEDLVREAVRLGFTSIMFDASKLPYERNVAVTRAVTEYGHRADVLVEAELGEIGGKDGAHAPGVRTDPDEARAFAEATAVDCLAVAVGSSHAMATRDAVLDFELIGRLRGSTGVPLVLHGSSGVSDTDLAKAVTAGMTKANVSTRLNGIFPATVRRELDRRPTVGDSRTYIGAAREEVASEVARLLRVLALA